MLKIKRYKKGKYVGETNAFFLEGVTYKGKFDVYHVGRHESCILVLNHCKVLKCSPDCWMFKDAWEE